MEFVLSFNEGNGNVAPPPPPPPSENQTPTPPPPITPEGGNNGEINTLMVVLAYFGIFALIPFFAEKEDEFVQYHAKQGLFLAIVELVFFIVVLPVVSLIPFLGCVVGILSLFFPFVLLVFHIIWMVKASKGERFEIPFVTTYAKQLFK
jgi:uncharacterized membrane protein